MILCYCRLERVGREWSKEELRLWRRTVEEAVGEGGWREATRVDPQSGPPGDQRVLMRPLVDGNDVYTHSLYV